MKPMKDTPLIRMTGITKRFAEVVANDRVDFTLKTGEIRSILGENGAGKTTLMNVLSGMCQPDEGQIYIRGQRVQFRSPQDALKFGIGMVYQHFTLIPSLTVLENIMLGFEGGFFLNLQKAAAKLDHIGETFGLSIDPQRRIQDLSVAERQRTEILKILYHESDIMVLDEPASLLSPAETETLYDTLKLLRRFGKSVVLITHRLNEALLLSDAITVMKSGRKIADLRVDTLKAMGKKAASDKILELMFDQVPQTADPGLETLLNTDPLLVLRNVEVANSHGQIGLKRISLSVAKGQIVGFTGAAGADQRLLADVIGGQKMAISGSLHYQGRDITRSEIAERFELGIRYISDDRINEGCAVDMAIAENAILQGYHRPPFSRCGRLNRAQIRSFAADLIRRFAIRSAGAEKPVSTLSGGNLQKLILARNLCGRPGLIVCNRPTYGLDTKTARFIQDLLKEESRRGAAVVLLTTDLDELFSCASRIGVLYKGEIVGLMDRREATYDNIAKLMFGVN